MKIIDTSSEVKFQYPENPSFGSANLPIIAWSDLGDEKEIHISNTDSLPFSPFFSALHYGQSIFEGMKAYYLNESEVGVFRSDLHSKRFIRSAQIMSMDVINEDFFNQALKAYVKKIKKYVPTLEGHSLYLRPLLFAQDTVIKVRSSKKFKFIIMSSIVGNYFSKNSQGQKILVNKKFTRAFQNGCGEAKTSANYALSIPALEYAYSKGFDQVMYLDALEKSQIEELGGMNFFYVENGIIKTPKLEGTILHGITRRSILELAPSLGLEVQEENLTLDGLIKKSKNGSISEIFATGTAASIAPLAEIGIEDSKSSDIQRIKFDKHPIAMKLRTYLENTHRDKTKHSKKWLYKI